MVSVWMWPLLHNRFRFALDTFHIKQYPFLMELSIRRYEAADNPAVKALSYAGLVQMGGGVDSPEFAKYDQDLSDIETNYLHSRGDFLVGLNGGKIVAMGAIRPKTDTCGEIKRLRVGQQHQRRGYASIMLERLAERAVELGYTELVLDTVTHNHGAQRLFESCGYVETKRDWRGPFFLVFYYKKL